MIIVSGRPEKYKKLTEQWLTWNNIYYDDLYMRKDGDQRKDNVIKQEILKHIKEKYEISFAFDDRKSVVDMWREMVCFVFNVKIIIINLLHCVSYTPNTMRKRQYYLE